MSKQVKKPVVEAPKVEAPKHKCDKCGRDDFKSYLALRIHQGQRHKAKAEPTPRPADRPASCIPPEVTATITAAIPLGKLSAAITAFGQLGAKEVQIVF